MTAKKASRKYLEFALFVLALWLPYALDFSTHGEYSKALLVLWGIGWGFLIGTGYGRHNNLDHPPYTP